MRTTSTYLAGGLVAVLALFGCGHAEHGGPAPDPVLRINEVVSDNEGVALDEVGEADDYIELVNAGSVPLNLASYFVADGSGVHALPNLELEPGAVALLWADDTVEQGTLHLPFKISASGELLRLTDAHGVVVDEVDVPPLAEHHAFQRMPDGTGPFVDCGYATPGRANGTICGPPEPPPIPDDVSFRPFQWSEPWPDPPSPLAITELALNPAAFVELVNVSGEPVSLEEYELRLAPHAIGEPWPAPDAGTPIALEPDTIEPGARVVVAMSAADLGALADDPELEGVLQLFRTSDGATVQRVDFNAWPEGAVLAAPDDNGRFRFCTNASPGEPNTDCQPLARRAVADHLRRLATEADFHELAAGRSALGTESVEFLIDLDGGGVVTFLNSADWDLHYTFVREKIDGQPHLDRCKPEEYQLFYAAWYAFSEQNYFRVEGRRYLLGTLVRHAGPGLSTVQFAAGDVISAEQMKQAFFTVMQNVPNPTEWSIRPQAPDQLERIRAIDGAAPIVPPNAPFRDVTFQPLTAAIAYGTLRFVKSTDLRSAELGPQDIVVTDQVPNDIPLIGGLVTEALQTPLAHVNILSRGRGTPNMALVKARQDPRVEPFFDTLVRLEVTGSDFFITPASPEEALAFWEQRRPDGPPLTPRLDATVRDLQPLSERSLADIPSIGGKAAQLAELARVPLCTSVIVPRDGFAVPLVHSVEHFEASGARELLDELREDPSFLAKPSVRAEGLARVRAAILEHPLDPALEAEIQDAIVARWPGQAVRFRSSGNAEDLAGFSGAGLYESVGLGADEVPSGVADAVRTVWASLWELRAYDERDFYNVAQDGVGMGVLVHRAFKSERVNGVAISRDVLDPTRGSRQYFNVQVGEALVTNPAPGIQSEQFTFEPGGYVPFVYLEASSFRPNGHVLTEREVAIVSCNLEAIESHFRPLIDENHENPWFAVDIEFKLMGPNRDLAIKQARPYSFGRSVPVSWCDF